MSVRKQPTKVKEFLAAAPLQQALEQCVKDMNGGLGSVTRTQLNLGDFELAIGLGDRRLVAQVHLVVTLDREEQMGEAWKAEQLESETP